MKHEGSREYLVGSVSVKDTSILMFTSTIEQIPYESSFYFKEAIYLNIRDITQNGVESNGLTMLYDINELKALYYAILEIVDAPIEQNRNKQSSYENITSSNPNFIQKTWLGFSNNSYYINVDKISTIKRKDLNISRKFKADKYRLLAFADSIFQLARKTEDMKFAFERKKDKMLRNKKEQNLQ